MSLILFLGGGATSAAVQLPGNSFTSSGVAPVYSGLKIAADGSLYERQNTGGWSRFGTWLLAGTNSNYYVSRTVNQGTLTTDAGAGPLQLNADRIYDVQVNVGDETVFIRFDIASDVSGSPIVATANYAFTAIVSTLD